MAQQIKAYKDKKIADYLREKPSRVGLFFWHGLGDLLMFIKPLEALRKQFPDTNIELILQDGIGQHEICPEAKLVGSDRELEKFDHDYIFHVHFPMSEYDNKLIPKPEKCCRDELGIEPVCGHPTLSVPESTLVGVSYQVTALPERASVNRDVSEKIWNEIKESGYIPIEVMMEHRYHNPKNSKYGFIDSTIRGAKAEISSMLSVIARCYAFMGTSSGPMHLALSVLPANRLAYLEKDFKLESITREPLKVFNAYEYKSGEVRQWLNTLS